MIVSYREQAPAIHRDAWVAQDATVSGNVIVGAGSRVMHGARLIAEAGGSIQIGRNCIVLENAVIRATASHSCTVGDHCLVGPNSHVVGAEIDDEVFLATGAAVFHGARVGRHSQVRINGTVHLRTELEPGSIVPIGWVAIGVPAQILSPDQHDKIVDLLDPLDFPMFVYGIDRSVPGAMVRITEKMSSQLAVHSTERPCSDAS